MTVLTAEIDRDRYGRPLIVPPGGGNRIAYTRASTWADTLDDRYNLELWKLRQVAIGLNERPDLALLVAAQRDDKDALNATCEMAMEAAKSKAGANTGTALHKLTEYVDRGEELPTVPVDTLMSLDAYEKVTAPLQVLAIEQFVVLDDLQVAGSFDRIVEYQGRQMIADLKTGDGIEWGIGGISIQLACYAHGQLYDPRTFERTPLDVDLNRAIVIWLPQGQPGVCKLLWVDIGLGWHAAQLAKRVRDFRQFSRHGLSTPFEVGALSP